MQTHFIRLGTVLGTALILTLSAMMGLIWLREAQASPANAPLTVTNTNDSGSGSLREAISLANPGDTIDFAVNGVITLTSSSLIITKSLTISGPGASELTISGNNATRVFDIGGGTVVISGVVIADGAGAFTGAGIKTLGVGTDVTLKNCVVQNNTTMSGFEGAGIYNEAGVSLLIDGCVISHNHANGMLFDSAIGGGIFNRRLLTLLNSTVVSNTADGGGGIYTSSGLVLTNTRFLSNTGILGGGGVFADSQTNTTYVTVDGGLFQNNVSTEISSYGGGLAVHGTLSLTGTQFFSNTSASGGGGAFAANGATLNGGLFQNNTCTGSDCYGGGLLVSGPTSLIGTQFLSNTSAFIGGGALIVGAMTLHGGLFQNNRSLASDAGGGGLWINGTLNLTGTQFLGNRADFDGGGVYHVGNSGGTGRIVNAVFAGNSANHSGAALFLSPTGNIEILHTTIASPTVGFGASIVIDDGTVGITNTLIANYTVGISQTNGIAYENYNLFYNTSVSKMGVFVGGSGVNDVTDNPDFINPTLNDYHLGLTSAAIDAGANVGVMSDFDGDPRPLDNNFDIGYDENANQQRMYLPLILK